MRVLIVLLVFLLGFCQTPAVAFANIRTVVYQSIQSERHSKPINPLQENQEDDELTDEDEDFSDESFISWNYSTLLRLNQLSINFKFYLLGKSNGHMNPIVAPPDLLYTAY